MSLTKGHMHWWLVMGLLLLSACVTVNVYFPAAAAEQAADSIIDDVWGEKPDAESSETSPQGALGSGDRTWVRVVDVVLPAAQAAANLNVDTPVIKKIKSAMSKRNRQLLPFYKSGAIGLTRDGLIRVRDAKAAPGNQRGTLNQLVAAENKDRNALYREIAKANGHPEWESDIRATFAGQWIKRAPRGYWYQASGGWRQK